MKIGQWDSHMKGQGKAKTKEKRKKRESPVRYIKQRIKKMKIVKRWREAGEKKAQQIDHQQSIVV